MSAFDEFRAAIPELFDAFDLPAILITRTTDTRTNADRAAGRKGTISTQTIDARGVVGVRKVKLADGTEAQKTIATSSAELRVGDVIAIGTRSYEVLETTEINPDAQAPMIFKAVVK